MAWKVEVSDEFERWQESLTDDEKVRVDASIIVLEHVGPALGRPHVDTLKNSRIKNLKELRVQQSGRPFRILFVFDPRRVAFLLLGGDKTGDARWYRKMIPLAETIYERHLKSLKGGK
jgi:hypothetical protein